MAGGSSAIRGNLPSSAPSRPVCLNKPTDTPSPINTLGTSGCSDNSVFTADMTIDDNTVMASGENFTKIWCIAEEHSGGGPIQKAKAHYRTMGQRETLT